MKISFSLHTYCSISQHVQLIVDWIESYYSLHLRSCLKYLFFCLEFSFLCFESLSSWTQQNREIAFVENLLFRKCWNITNLEMKQWKVEYYQYFSYHLTSYVSTRAKNPFGKAIANETIAAISPSFASSEFTPAKTFAKLVRCFSASSSKLAETPVYRSIID